MAEIVDKSRQKGRHQYHIDLKPGDTGRYVLLPGDPARVERVAKFLEKPVEVAYKREYRTVTGFYKGIKVSTTSTGIGCPSTAIAVEELANVGADTFIRIGSTGALDPDLHPGNLVIATGAMRNEGTTRYYAALEFPAVPDLFLTHSLITTAKSLQDRLDFSYKVGIVSSDDAFYAETPEFLANLRKLNIVSIEMESAAIFVICQLRNLRGAMIASVSGNLMTGELDYDGSFAAKVEKGWDDEIQVALEAIVNLKD